MEKMTGSVDSILLTPGLDTLDCRLTGQGSCTFCASMMAAVLVNGHVVSPGLLLPWIMRATHPVDVTLYPDEDRGGVSYRTEFHGDPL